LDRLCGSSRLWQRLFVDVRNTAAELRASAGAVYAAAVTSLQCSLVCTQWIASSISFLTLQCTLE
jgi:hypothetical protein